MTFIYLSSMVKKEGDKRCAVAAHVIPTEIDGFLRIDGYASGDSSMKKQKKKYTSKNVLDHNLFLEADIFL